MEKTDEEVTGLFSSVAGLFSSVAGGAGIYIIQKGESLVIF